MAHVEPKDAREAHLEDIELTSPEATARVGVHPQVVIRYALAGAIRGRKRGGRWFFNAADIERLVRDRAQKVNR